MTPPPQHADLVITRDRHTALEAAYAGRLALHLHTIRPPDCRCRDEPLFTDVATLYSADATELCRLCQSAGLHQLDLEGHAQIRHTHICGAPLAALVGAHQAANLPRGRLA